MTIGNEFCIDSKAFKLAFDGGRVDPYHIMERRGRFRGSLWIGITGLRWMLDNFVTIKNTNQTLEGFFVFHRDGYRVLEFSCLANRGGRFVEITEYHSGTHRGSIRIPEGRKGAGWSVFEFQVRKCFLGATQNPSTVPAISRRDSDDGEAAVRAGPSRKEVKRREWKSRKSRRTKSAPDLQPSITLLNLRDEISKLALNEPRPTRQTHFKWKPNSRTLRVMLDHGSRRQVSWVDVQEVAGPKAQKTESVLKIDGPQFEKAQLIVDPEPARLEVQTQDKGCETHNPVISTERLDTNPSVDEGRGTGLVCEHGRMDSPADEAQNQVVDLWQELPAAEEAEEVSLKLRSMFLEEQKETSYLERAAEADSEHGLGSALVQERATVIVSEVEPPKFTPAAFSLAIAEGGEGEGPLSPLTCSPITMLGPPMNSPGMELIGDGADALYKPSQWVAMQMNMFRKQVGVSIKGHEVECLALLRKIEVDRKPKKSTLVLGRQSKKGLRELKNLASSVNYSGKQLSCC